MKQIESFIQHWPRTAILMVAGALFGWFLWMFLPQEYTAVTKLSVSIDYNRTGKLDDIEQDRLLGVTEDILHSREIMEQVRQQSGEEDYTAFFNKTLTSRTNETWSLSITGKDPEETGKLALLWLDVAHEALHKAKGHALREEALRNELDGLTRCIQDSVPGSSSAGCLENREEIFQRIDEYTKAIQDEFSASHGLSSAVIIGHKDTQLELKPASRTAAADTLIGAFVGLLAAFALEWFPKKESQK